MGRKINITTKQGACAYIEKVLSKWTEFGRTHRPFIAALKIILKENNTAPSGFLGRKE